MAAQTTTRLTPNRLAALRRWFREQDPLLVIFVLAFVLVIAAGPIVNLWNNRTQSSIIIVATPRPTPALPTSKATAASVQVADASIARLPRAVVAYHEPRPDAVLRAVDSGAAYTATEQLDGRWLHAEIEGIGPAWLEIAELAGIAGVPNAAPPPTQPAEAPPAQPAAEVIVFVAAPAAEPAAQPTVAPSLPTIAPAPTSAPSWMVLHVASTPTPNGFADSFQEPATNPFIGCLTDACRERFGQPTAAAELP
jgi:hypothetical protein